MTQIIVVVFLLRARSCERLPLMVPFARSIVGKNVHTINLNFDVKGFIERNQEKIIRFKFYIGNLNTLLTNMN